MKQDVLNIKGKSTGREIVLNKSIFQIQPNEHAVYLDVKQYLAHQRTGTHKSKERSEIKEVLEKSRGKKELELLELAVSKIQYFEEEVVHSGRELDHTLKK